MAKTQYEQQLAEDVRNQKGTSYPVKASILERLFIRKTACSNLHPNAEDEFTHDDVGPSYRIIGEYEEKIRTALRFGNPIMDEPLMVEKLYPKGYLLLNGHHRWAAAVRCQVKTVPIKIVNLASDSDIQKILENSKHDKRVTLDLDEVVFRDLKDPNTEKQKSFVLALDSKKKLKKGIPALFRYLAKNGFDIWVYSSNYYSIDDVQRFFKAYQVHVDGIITGAEARKKDNKYAISREKMISAKYRQTIHVDNDMLIVTGDLGENGPKFKKYDLNSSPEDWSVKAVEALEQIVAEDGKKQ